MDNGASLRSWGHAWSPVGQHMNTVEELKTDGAGRRVTAVILFHKAKIHVLEVMHEGRFSTGIYAGGKSLSKSAQTLILLW